jgi:AraC-like DNA-binding protein/TolB-like protein
MKGVNHTGEQFLQSITAIIDANLHNEHFGVAELATQLGMSRISLHRKVKSVISKSVSVFIRETRLKRALELLHENDLTVSEIAYKVGFGSVTYFTKCFHDYYGYPPGEAKKHPTKTISNEIPLAEKKPASGKKWVQVAVAAVFIVVVAVILTEVFFLGLFAKEKTKAENTIAILPFINDSGEEFAPFTTWMAIEIGNKLGKIENMLVVPQSTTEAYRNTKKSNRDIARELMVEHILRGRTFKTGDKILLNIELLGAKNSNVVFTEIYERDLDETEESDLNRIFEICGNVVFQISDILQTRLTHGEKEEVTKINTQNMAALRTYQQANHHLELSGLNDHTNIPVAIEEFMKAKKLLEEAIAIDSTFADAYAMLGHIYIYKLPFYASIYLADKYLDTCKIYLDKAMQLDKNNLNTMGLLRHYYIQKGMTKEADQLLPAENKRVKNYIYYMGKFYESLDLNDRYLVAEAYLNYIKTKPTDITVQNYMSDKAFFNYLETGFPIRARELNDESLKSMRETVPYLMRKAWWENDYGSKDSALAIFYEVSKKDTSLTNHLHYGIHPKIDHLYYGIQMYNDKNEHAKALDTLKKLEAKVELLIGSIIPNYHVCGYTYLKNGMKEKADYHFKGSIKSAENEIKLNSANARNYVSHFRLARIYSILDDKQKSLHYLEMIKESPSVPFYLINELKTNPMFDNIRQDPELQKITRELEKKYLKNHEQIKKLLISNGLEPV